MKHSHPSENSIHPPVANTEVFSGVNSAINLFRQGWSKLLSPLQIGSESTELIEIVENLKSDGSKIKVRLNGNSNTYTSKITAVSPEHRMLVIETLNPVHNKAPLLSGSTICLEAQNKGKIIDIPCQFIDDLVPNLEAGHQLKLPSRVKH